jgi:GxxExxY protein
LIASAGAGCTARSLTTLGFDVDRDPLTHEIIGAAIAVSKGTRVGLLEDAYERFLARELAKRGLKVERQKSFPAEWDGYTVEVAYRPDLVVEGKVIVEVKAVEKLSPVHEHQILTYMYFSKCSTGLLLNFHAFPFTEKGIKRFKL